jgi:hypothetical protein
VDPTNWGITDYFDVIKHPMDFGTIKVRKKQQIHFNFPHHFGKFFDHIKK